MPRRIINNCIQSWKDLTEPKYPLLFINRWIPFNAWYMSVSGEQNDNDSFQFFKDNPDNALYGRIKQLIQNSKGDLDCMLFQNQLYLLESALRNKDVPAPGAPNPIFFGPVEMRVNTVVFDKMGRNGGLQFKAVRYQSGNAQGKPAKSVELIVEDLRTGSVSVVYNWSKWDEADFKSKISRSRAYNAAQKKMMMALFSAINPIEVKNVKDFSSGKIKIGKSFFCSDRDIICASIMDVLYALRCKAVHGEIEVTDKMLEIYCYAYQMLTLITKDLF